VGLNTGDPGAAMRDAVRGSNRRRPELQGISRLAADRTSASRRIFLLSVSEMGRFEEECHPNYHYEE
jgi:hypothetical protein